MSDVFVSQSPIAGRGVFAGRDFKIGDLIEECHVLRVPTEQLQHLDQTVVYEHYFAWGEDGAIALGNGSLYNHDEDANGEYIKDLDNDRLSFRAVSPISSGEEITINYSRPKQLSTQ